jgi:hypothetical protein
LDSSSRRLYSGWSLAIALTGYSSPVALLAADCYVPAARRLPGTVLYCDMAFGIVCVVLAALLLRVALWKRLAAAIIATIGFLIEILLLAMLAVAVTGPKEIQ